MDTAMKKKLKKIIVAVVIIAVVLTGIFVIKAHKIEITYRLLYQMMPDQYEATLSDETKFPVYKRINDDYDSKKDKEIDFMEFYYYDENGNEVVVGAADELIRNDENLGSPYFAFMLGSTDKIEKVKTTVTIIGVVIGIVIIAALIVFWFFRWSKKQDKEKEEKYGNNKNKKKKNKKKK